MIPRMYIKLGTVAYIYTPRTPMRRWKVGTWESLDIHRLASLLLCCNKTRDPVSNNWKPRSSIRGCLLNTHALCSVWCVHSYVCLHVCYTHRHTYSHCLLEIRQGPTVKAKQVSNLWKSPACCSAGIMCGSPYPAKYRSSDSGDPENTCIYQTLWKSMETLRSWLYRALGHFLEGKSTKPA